MLWHHKASLYSFHLLPYNNAVSPQSFIVLILFLPIQQCCDKTNLYCTHFIYYHTTMLWHHKASLCSFFFFPSNNVVTPQSFSVLIHYYTAMLWHHKGSLYSFHSLQQNNAVAPQRCIVLIYLLPQNNAIAPQSCIVLIHFLPIQQCCDTTKLYCPHSIYSHTTVLWHHKALLSSVLLFPSNNVVTPQSFIVLIVFLPIQQCCDTTKLRCICSYPTMLWHHKASLSSFYFLWYNSVVIPQTSIVLI